ncbi:hypothetical protein B4135_0522 [Caldibacillus debilis]|uniref:Uncharacterized protein n=1 Tax=Caldibacillus debilis TaxID=301148 RepID=A0A150M9I0_9BACI|nr:hypothetical protein B4135_0522 [Caldibacillus debilis]
MIPLPLGRTGRFAVPARGQPLRPKPAGSVEGPSFDRSREPLLPPELRAAFLL